MIVKEVKIQQGYTLSKMCINSILNDAVLLNRISNAQLLGELGIPNIFDVDLKNVSHVVTNMFSYKDKLYVNIEVLNTPSGKKLQQLISDKVEWNIVARMSVTERRTVPSVIERCKIFTFDIRNEKEVLLNKWSGLDFIPVQPMAAPSGMLFYLDFKYEGSTKVEKELFEQVTKDTSEIDKTIIKGDVVITSTAEDYNEYPDISDYIYFSEYIIKKYNG